MCCIIRDGSVIHMSAVIGICGENFCSLIADERKTVNQGMGYRVVDDDFQKIFKINNRVLLGVSGLFGIEEKLTAPLDVYRDTRELSLRSVYKAVMSYLDRYRYQIHMPRNYLVGGKDNKGRFCIYEVHFNVETQEAETVMRMPEPPNSNYAVSCALPHELARETETVLAEISDRITDSKRHDEMIEKVSDLILDLSELNGSIGKNVCSLTVY